MSTQLTLLASTRPTKPTASERDDTKAYGGELAFIGPDPQVAFVGPDPQVAFVGPDPQVAFVGPNPELGGRTVELRLRQVSEAMTGNRSNAEHDT